MAVCPVRPDGYCERHGVVHRGAWLRWALDPSEAGEAYRLKWDRQPTRQEIEPTGPPARSKSIRRVERRHILCRHLGPPTGEERACGTCGEANLRVSLHLCARHGRCTLQRPVRNDAGDYEACCFTCKDYEPVDPAECGALAIAFRPPDRPQGGHGLGDATHFAHLVALYARHGVPIAVACLADHAPLFKAAGAVIVSDGAPHPWPDPPKGFAGPGAPPWQRNKNGQAINAPPLPHLGDPDLLWQEYCDLRLDFAAQVEPAAWRWAEELLGRWPGPRVILHTQGYGWGAFRNYAAEDSLALQRLLVEVLDAYVLVLDRERGAAAWDHPRVRRVRDFGVEQLHALQAKADLFVGIDSGPLHFLRFSATPGLGLWDVHYPSHFALPRDQTLHCVAAHHARRDVHERWTWNTVLAPDHGSPRFVLELIRRLLAPPRYLPQGPIARDVQLQHFVDRTCSPFRHPRWAQAVDRHVSFDLALRRLRDRKEPVIVETGVIRQEEDWQGAGYATYLFGAFVSLHGGQLHSVDCEPRHAAFARGATAGFRGVSIHEGDSVAWLRRYDGPPIDLLYCDSLDADLPGAAEHCLAEVQAAAPHLAPDACILIDDTPPDAGLTGWEGKGALAAPWLVKRGWRVVHSGWQVLLQAPASRRGQKPAV